MSGWFLEIFFRRGKDSGKFVNAEIVVITCLSAAISIPSLIFSDAPKSSAVTIKNLLHANPDPFSKAVLSDIKKTVKKVLIKIIGLCFITQVNEEILACEIELAGKCR